MSPLVLLTWNESLPAMEPAREHLVARFQASFLSKLAVFSSSFYFVTFDHLDRHILSAFPSEKSIESKVLLTSFNAVASSGNFDFFFFFFFLDVSGGRFPLPWSFRRRSLQLTKKNRRTNRNRF